MAPTNAEVKMILRRLLKWADMMGGWEAPVWDDVRSLLARMPDDA